MFATVGVTDTLNFTNWYREENGVYNVEALLEISYEPMPSPTTSSKYFFSKTFCCLIILICVE